MSEEDQSKAAPLIFKCIHIRLCRKNSVLTTPNHVRDGALSSKRPKVSCVLQLYYTVYGAIEITTEPCNRTPWTHMDPSANAFHCGQEEANFTTKRKKEQEVKILLKQQHQTTSPTNRPHSDNAHSIVVRTMHCHCNRSFNRHIEPLQPGSAHCTLSQPLATDLNQIFLLLNYR